MELLNEFILDKIPSHISVCNHRQGPHYNSDNNIITNWLDNNLHGKYHTYYSNKILYKVGYFEHGKPMGIHQIYRKLSASSTFAVNCKSYRCTTDCSSESIPCGKCYSEISYHRPYEIRYEHQFVDGKKHGICKKYALGNLPWVEESYVRGELHGEAKVYHISTTTLRSVINYAYGKKHGTSKKFRSNGTLLSTAEYVNDKKHGIYACFRSNGLLLSQYTYRDDLLHGISCINTVMKNGTVKNAEFTYVNGFPI